MAYQYLPGDLLGKETMVDKDYNAVTFKPWSAELRKQASAGWKTSIPHENYNGRYVEVLKNVPNEPGNRVSAYLEFLFLPSENKYYKFHGQSKPVRLKPGVPFVCLMIDQGESSTSIKSKLKKLSESNKVISINPATVCPLIHKLTQSGGDPEGLLPLLDRVIAMSERNLNSPPSGCIIS